MELIDQIHSELNSYKNLQDGWDGDDSIRPTDTAIDNAINFVNSLGDLVNLIDEDYIYPTGDGTIIIDFQNDIGDLVSVEISTNSIGYFFQSEGHVNVVDSDKIIDGKFLSPKLKGCIEKVNYK